MPSDGNDSLVGSLARRHPAPIVPVGDRRLSNTATTAPSNSVRAFTVLAERMDTTRIVTLDRRHFTVLRSNRGQPFDLYP